MWSWCSPGVRACSIMGEVTLSPLSVEIKAFSGLVVTVSRVVFLGAGMSS